MSRHQALGVCPCGDQHAIHEAAALNEAADLVPVTVYVTIEHTETVALYVPRAEVDSADWYALVKERLPHDDVTAIADVRVDP